MDRLRQRIAHHSTIGLDTSVFIYHLENHARYQPVTRRVLQAVEDGAVKAVFSTVGLMELTVHPWQQRKSAVARQYEVLLVNFPNLILADVTRHVARRAARLRAQYQLKPADALHVSTAISHAAGCFITNDRGIARLELELDVIILDDFVE